MDRFRSISELSVKGDEEHLIDCELDGSWGFRCDRRGRLGLRRKELSSSPFFLLFFVSEKSLAALVGCEAWEKSRTPNPVVVDDCFFRFSCEDAARTRTRPVGYASLFANPSPGIYSDGSGFICASTLQCSFLNPLGGASSNKKRAVLARGGRDCELESGCGDKGVTSASSSSPLELSSSDCSSESSMSEEHGPKATTY